jgi:hypothetical protein
VNRSLFGVNGVALTAFFLEEVSWIGWDCIGRYYLPGKLLLLGQEKLLYISDID